MLIIGLLYLYRAITMWVTVLPSADPTYECAPKFGKPLTVKELFKRVFTIMTGKKRNEKCFRNTYSQIEKASVHENT